MFDFLFFIQLIFIALFSWLLSSSDLKSKTPKVNLTILLVCSLINVWFAILSILTLFWLQPKKYLGLTDVLILSIGFVFLNQIWLVFFEWLALSFLGVIFYVSFNFFFKKKIFKSVAYIPFLLFSLFVLKFVS